MKPTQHIPEDAEGPKCPMCGALTDTYVAQYGRGDDESAVYTYCTKEECYYMKTEGKGVPSPA